MSYFKDKPGYVCLYDDGTEVYNQFDKIFMQFIEGEKIKYFRVPALISKEILDKCNYFSSFPHNLTAVACCQKELVSNGEFLVNCDCNYNNIVKVSDEYYLLPSACMHIYPMLKELDDIKNISVTTSAKVFRNETDGYNDLERLWDFSVREFVFVGDSQFVLDSLSNMKKLVYEFAKDLFRDIEIVLATDNFYPTKENKIMQMIQKKNGLKHELIHKTGDSNLALCSFNYHGTHFSKAFEFDNNDEVVTGCVGFGMERWLEVYYSKADTDELNRKLKQKIQAK